MKNSIIGSIIVLAACAGSYKIAADITELRIAEQCSQMHLAIISNGLYLCGPADGDRAVSQALLVDM